MTSKSTPSNRSKISAACENCRANHRKCDGGHPCINCSKKGKDCLYKPRKKRGPKKRVRTDFGGTPQPRKKSKTIKQESDEDSAPVQPSGRQADSHRIPMHHTPLPQHSFHPSHHHAAHYHVPPQQQMPLPSYRGSHQQMPHHPSPYSNPSFPYAGTAPTAQQPFPAPAQQHHYPYLQASSHSMYHAPPQHHPAPHHHQAQVFSSTGEPQQRFAAPNTLSQSSVSSAFVSQQQRGTPSYGSASGNSSSLAPPDLMPLSRVSQQEQLSHPHTQYTPSQPPPASTVTPSSPPSDNTPPVSSQYSATTTTTSNPLPSQLDISSLYEASNRLKSVSGGSFHTAIPSPEDITTAAPSTPSLGDPESAPPDAVATLTAGIKIESTNDTEQEEQTTLTINGDDTSQSNPFAYDDHQSTLSLYYTTLVSNWIDSYDLYMTPSHSMLPVNRKSFHAVVPHLLKDLIVDNHNAKENNFFLCALLANSATSMGDNSFGRSFFTRARQLAGHLFDSIDYRVGLGFMLLCYYSFVHLEVENCITYMRLAENIASYFGEGCHLAKQCIVANAYTARSTEAKVANFERLGEGDLLTLGDVVWSKVGTASCLAEANPATAASQLDTIEEALSLLTPENVNSGQVSVWHWFYIHTHRIFVLSLSGRHKEAQDAADIVLAKTQNSMWKYFNVPMRVRTLATVAHVYSAPKEPLSSETWDKISQVYDRMEEIIKYPYAFSNLNELMKSIESRRCEEAELAIESNGTLHDKDTVSDGVSMNLEEFQLEGVSIGELDDKE